MKTAPTAPLAGMSPPSTRLPSLRLVQSLALLLLLMWIDGAQAAVTTSQISSPGNPWLPEYWNNIARQSMDAAIKRQPNTNVAKNLVLVIGDGMGISTSTAARILLGQQQNKLGEEGLLAWEKFPHLALSKTYNTDAMTADSAGTATAYHFGFKTKFGVIGLDDRVIRGNCSTEKIASSAASKSMLELAELAGKSTGIVTTARITHASPSPLYARSAHRDWEADSNMPINARGDCRDIARQLIENGSNIEVIMGGGRSKFLPTNESDPEYPTKKGERSDGRNLLQEWQQKQLSLNRQCRYVWNQEGFDNVNAASSDCVLALFEPSHMLYEEDKINSTAREPSLTQMVEKAIQILSKNPKGFYLFIEGGKIDHGHHNSLARYALTETVEMHRAVNKVMEMTDEKDTLVIVSADHSHVFNIVGYPQRGTPIFGLSHNVEDGTATDGMPYTVLMYANGPGYKQPRQNLTGVDTTNKSYVYQSGVPLRSETHGGEDVAIYASGPMSHLFYGVQEQSYIPHVMAYASCIGTNKQHCATITPANIASAVCDMSRGAAFRILVIAVAGLKSVMTILGL